MADKVCIRCLQRHPEAEQCVNSPADQLNEALRLSRAIRDVSTRIEAINTANGWFDVGRSMGDDMALLHSEVSEAYEAYRKNDPDNFREELADVFIRLMDTCTRHGVNLTREVYRKLEINAQRGYRHGGKVV